MDIVNHAIVIDNGSNQIRAGIAGEEAPRCSFPNVVGKTKMPSIMIGMEQKNQYIGAEAHEKKGILTLKQPMERGIIQDWDQMQKIWHHIYSNEIKMQPDDQPCLITEVPLNPIQNREKMCEIMFETFKVPNLYIALQSVLSLYATGRVTGLVVDIGDGVSSVVPVFDGYCIKQAMQRLDIGGKDITNYLQQQIKHKLQSSQSFHIANEIKETQCYISYQQEKDEQQGNFILPDGNSIQIKDLCYKSPEILFNPSILGHEQQGIQHYIRQSISKCELTISSELQQNIYLNGGSSLFQGMSQRLQKELILQQNENQTTNIISPAERKLSVLNGGIILASLSMFQTMWISKKDYQEQGLRVINTHLI